MKLFFTSAKTYSMTALLASVIFAVLASLVSTQALGEDTKVKSRAGTLGDAADLNRRHAEAGADARTGDTDATPPAGQKVVHITFDQPDNNLPFKQFSQRKTVDGKMNAQPTYVDLPADGHGITTDREKDDSSAQIKIKIVFDLTKDDAAFFPPWAEGNLGSTARGGAAPGQGQAPHWAAIYNNGKVSFSPNPIVTGFANKADGTPDIHSLKVTVTATVFPASKINQLKSTLAIDTTTPGKDEAKIENIQVVDATAGVITFDVYGQVATPVGSPDGDTQIVAKDSDGTLLGKAKVIVVVPTKIGTPHMTDNPMSFPVKPTKICADKKSSPAYPTCPDGKFLAFVAYGTLMQMKVVDQFGNLLDSVYDNQQVTEGGKIMNQNVLGGYYNDPAGTGSTYGLQTDTPEVRNEWLNSIVPTLPPGEQPEKDLSTPVEVAGHSLNPAVVNRKGVLTNGTTGFSIKITWPD